MALLVGELYALLLLEKKAFMKGLKEAEKAGAGTAASMGQNFMAAGKMIAIGLAVGVVGLTAFAAVSLNASMEFEKGMARVQTLVGKGSVADARIKELGESVKAMSITTGKSLKDLSEGLYDVIGTFTDTADSAKWLEIAAKSGAAGMSTTRESIRLLAAITKSYGDTSIVAAQKAADLVFETANLGVTTFPEMAASMGKVLPISAALKVSQEELFGAMATLTGVTGDTAEVTTQLRSIMSAFLKPNTLMNKAIAETGYVSGTAMVQQLGLSGAMKLIGGTSVVADKGIAKVFGRVEALTAVLALNGAQATDWVWKTEAMRNSAGRTARAFEIQQATASAIIDRIGAALGVMAVEMGDKMMPAWKTFLHWVEDNLPTIKAIVLNVTEAVGNAFMTVAGVVGTAVGVIDSAWKSLGDIGAQGPIIVTVLGAIALAFAAWAVAAIAAAVGTVIAFAPVLITIAVIAAAVFGLVKVFEMFGYSVDEIIGGIGDMAKSLATSFLEMAGTIVGVLAAIPSPLQDQAKGLQATLDSMKADVQKWGKETGMAGFDASHNVGKMMDDGIKSSGVVDTYDKTGKNASKSLMDSLSGGLADGQSLTEAQLEDLGISMDDALAAGINVGEPMVAEATKSLVEKFGYNLSAVREAGSEEGAAAMSEMSKSIAEHRSAPLTAMDTLVALMKSALHPLTLAGKLAGTLASKALHKALKDNRPEVVAQAIATATLTADGLGELVLAGGKAGKKAMTALKKGMKDKDPVIRAASEHAVNVVEAELKKTQDIKDAGSALGRAAAAALKRGFGSPTLSATVKIYGRETKATGVREYATGAWNLERDQFAFIHQGEMVVPAAAANRIRQAAAQPSYDQLAQKQGSVGGTREIHNHLTVQGLVKARNPFEIVKQQQRLHDFGVMRWPQSQEVVS